MFFIFLLSLWRHHVKHRSNEIDDGALDTFFSFLSVVDLAPTLAYCHIYIFGKQTCIYVQPRGHADEIGFLKGNMKALLVRVLTSNLLGSVLDHVET